MCRVRSTTRLPRIAVLSLVVSVAAIGGGAVPAIGHAVDLDSQQTAGGQAGVGTNDENGSKSPVKRTTPTNGTVSVAPGSEVLFEAAATDYGGEYVLAEWTVDGELAASTDGFGSQYGREGEILLRHAFEAAGQHTVTATVVDANGERVGTVEWTVTVESGGNAAPEITDSTTAGSSTGENQETCGKASSTDGTANFSVDVADPDGDLHRVIWLLGMADARLGTSSVNGSTDTAQIGVNDTCNNCPVIVWVVDESGVVTERTVGTSPARENSSDGTAAY